MEKINFSGRILFLAEDPHLIERQLQGEDLRLAEAGKLRDDVSTDEITPGWTCFYVDETLGRYPYVGLTCGGRRPVQADDVKRGGFTVTVAGARYGKGSSREASPYAERVAGIRLVIAKKFERIYRQNCHNLGIYTSNDFALIDRIQAGEEIPVAELVEGLDSVTTEILWRGGLFNFTKARQNGQIELPRAELPMKPMSFVEKIMARSALSASAGAEASQQIHFLRVDWRYSHDYVTGMCAAFMEKAMGSRVQLHDVSSIKCFADHLVYVPQTMSAEKRAMGLLDSAMAMGVMQHKFCERYGVQLHHHAPGRSGAEGICHSIMTERYVLPGQVAIGTDSHTPHCGALGAFAFGVGATEMANAWITGDVRVATPKVCRVRLDGRLNAHVDAKDVVLHLLQLDEIKSGALVGLVFEYCGEAVLHMTTDARATLTNMVAEIGGMTGLIAPDDETVRFLRERRGVDFVLEDWMHSDAEALYAHEIVVDCSSLTPMVALPGDPGQGVPVSSLEAAVPVDIAYGGSCTGGKFEDIAAYHEVLAWGVERGLRIASGVQFFLQFGSQDVRRRSEQAGFVQLFKDLGVQLVDPGCGACINAGPGASERAEQITISAINRNFPGRSGPGALWLGSPSTVAASALAGRILSFDQLRDQVES
ncbi:aconitase family protein [Variovorax paradoxus]|uniref:aconitase family protein n=1 Tax=Variovorax paradoxus TaxID=34073 RepID=UPI0019326E4F|nr:3-isopropylmalate dehydratase [Variovorax paradoxus]